VDKVEVSDEYYGVARYTHFKLMSEIDGYNIYKKTWDDDEEDSADRKIPKFIFAERGNTIPMDDDGEKKFVIRGDNTFYVAENGLIKINQVQDTEVLTKLKILANLDSETKK